MTFRHFIFNKLALLALTLLIFHSCIPGKNGEFTITGERIYKIDKTAPKIISLSPENLSTDVGLNQNLIVTFDDQIKVSSIFLNQVVVSIVKADLSSSIEIDGAEVEVNANVVTINPPAPLDQNTDYYVVLSPQSLKNLRDLAFVGIDDDSGVGGLPTWAFKTEIITGITRSGTGNTSESGATAELTVVLDSAPSANVIVGLGSSDVGEGTPAVASLTFTSANWDTVQTVSISGVDDVLNDGTQSFDIEFSVSSADQNYHGLSVTALTFNNLDNDDVAPTMTLLSPLNGATTIPTTQNFTITFNENVQKGSGNILVRRYSDDVIIQTIDVSTANVSGAAVTITLSGLASSTQYYLEIASTCIADLSLNPNYYLGISDKLIWSFTTRDEAAPSVSTLSPADNSTGAVVSADLIITFNENIKKTDALDPSDILMQLRRSSDDVLIEQYTFDDARVAINANQITISDPANFLDSQTSYYLQVIAGSISDQSNNPFAGFSNNSTWNFTTEDTSAPSIVSLTPADNSTHNHLETNLVITFNKNVEAGVGTIDIRDALNDSIYASFSVPDPSVVFSGSTVTISFNPQNQGSYYVNIYSGTITESSSQKTAYAGFTDTTTWNFSTNVYREVEASHTILSADALEDISEDKTKGVYTSAGLVYLWDFDTQTSTLVSKFNSSGLPAGGTNPKISGDGLLVVYESSLAIDAADNYGSDIYVYDVISDINTKHTNARQTTATAMVGDTGCTVPVYESYSLYCDTNVSRAQNFSYNNNGVMYNMGAYYMSCEYQPDGAAIAPVDLLIGSSLFFDPVVGSFMSLFCNAMTFIPTYTHYWNSSTASGQVDNVDYQYCYFVGDNSLGTFMNAYPNYTLFSSGIYSEPVGSMVQESSFNYAKSYNYSKPDIDFDGSVIVFEEATQVSGAYNVSLDMPSSCAMAGYSTYSYSVSNIIKWDDALSAPQDKFQTVAEGNGNRGVSTMTGSYCNGSYDSEGTTTFSNPRVSPDGSKLVYVSSSYSDYYSEVFTQVGSCSHRQSRYEAFYYNGVQLNGVDLLIFETHPIDKTLHGFIGYFPLAVDDSKAVWGLSYNSRATSVGNGPFGLFCRASSDTGGALVQYQYTDEVFSTHYYDAPYNDCIFYSPGYENANISWLADLGYSVYYVGVGSGFYSFTRPAEEKILLTSTKFSGLSAVSTQNYWGALDFSQLPTRVELHPSRDEFLFSSADDLGISGAIDTNGLRDVYRMTLDFSLLEVVSNPVDGGHSNGTSGLSYFFNETGDAVQFTTSASNLGISLTPPSLVEKKLPALD